MRHSHQILEWIGIVAVTTILFLFGYRTGMRESGRKWQNAGIKTDTIELHHYDTIRLSMPVYLTRTEIDSVLVPVTDTLTIRDTLWMQLPREQAHYGDSLYDAWVSGYRPALDSLKIYRTTIERDITHTIQTKPKWSVGVTGGYGVSKDGLSPYIGVGLTYNIFSW